MVKTIIMVVYVIICIALTIIVLSQEGKSASLTSSITGGNYDNSYWGKNKGSSKDAVLRKITTVLGIHCFLILSCSSSYTEFISAYIYPICKHFLDIRRGIYDRRIKE